MMVRIVIAGVMALLIVSEALARPASHADAAPTCRACEQVAAFYAAREERLAWTGPGHAARYRDLIVAIEGAQTHGLNAADYHLEHLLTASPYWPNRSLDEVATDAYLTLASHLEFGRLDPTRVEPSWSAWHPQVDLGAYLDRPVRERGGGEPGGAGPGQPGVSSFAPRAGALPLGRRTRALAGH